jgi:hypothetical protein
MRWRGRREREKKVCHCLMVESEKYAQHLNEDFQTFKLFVAFFDVLFYPSPSKPGVYTSSRYIAMAYDIVLISDTFDNMRDLSAPQRRYQKQFHF